MMSSPVSSPRHTPRNSDTSCTSVYTFHSERKYSPPTTTIPAHPSTSTISRDSHASADDRQLTNVSSTTRIPKARVFVQRPDRPRQQSSRSGLLPRTLTPTHLENFGRQPRACEKRCVSDLHDAFQAHQLRVERTATPAPQSWVRRRGVTDFGGDMLGSDENVPKWIPTQELHHWKPATRYDPEYDPCVLEEAPSHKWGASLRQLSNLCKKDRSPPCLRGSVLAVQPPTLTERLGLGGLGSERRYGHRDTRQRNSGRRVNKHGKNRYDELTRRNSPTDVAYPQKAVEETGRDEYVGFLVQAPEPRSSRKRRGWLRFLRRGRM